MDLALTGRRVLVVGGSRGIGLAAAEQLAREGARVTIAARNADRLAAAAAELERGTGAAVATLRFDAGADDAATVLASRFGVEGLDALVFSPGGSIRSSFGDLADDDWLANYRFNVLGPVRTVRELLPALRRGTAPAIVLIGAAAAKMPYAHQVVSNVHKSGILALVKTLAVELAGEGIRVNAVCPGRTLTDLWRNRSEKLAAERGTTPDAIIEEFSEDIPLGRFAQPAEIASMIAFLLSPLTSYVTGQSINVDGGIARGLL